jgi:hypothetical protein
MVPVSGPPLLEPPLLEELETPPLLEEELEEPEAPPLLEEELETPPLLLELETPPLPLELETPPLLERRRRLASFGARPGSKQQPGAGHLRRASRRRHSVRAP